MFPQYPYKHRHHWCEDATYSEDEADGGHAGGGHDFGTVGDQVEEDRHGGLRSVVKPTAEHQRQVAGEQSRTMKEISAWVRTHPQLISGLDTDKSQFVPLKSWFCFGPTYCLAAHLKGNCATQTRVLCLTPEWYRPPSPPESGGPWRTIWTPPPWAAAAAETRQTLLRRPGAANAPSSAGGTGKEKKERSARTFSPNRSSWQRGQDVLQLPLGAPSPSYHLTAHLESSSWPPPPPCWSRSGGGQDRRKKSCQ